MAWHVSDLGATFEIGPFGEPRTLVSWVAIQTLMGEQRWERDRAAGLVGSKLEVTMNDGLRLIYQLTAWDPEAGMFTAEWPD